MRRRDFIKTGAVAVAGVKAFKEVPKTNEAIAGPPVLTHAEIARLLCVTKKTVVNCPITVDTIVRLIERAGEASLVGKRLYIEGGTRV